MKDLKAQGQSILVLGAGELGMSVLRSLAATGTFKSITVLLRPHSRNTTSAIKLQNIDELQSLGVSLVEGDIASISLQDLAELLRPFDTVVSCTGFVGGPGTQRKIAEAALAAEVKRFLPWQFGIDYDTIGRGSAQDLFDEQLGVRHLLRGQAHTQWVIISTGMFTSFLFEPAFGVFDLADGFVHALGGWENAVTLTTAEDIGRLTAEVLSTEPPIVNAVVFFAGDTLTYAQAAETAEQVLGVTLKRNVWTLDHLRRVLEDNPNNTMAKYHVVFAEGRGVSWPMNRTFNHTHGFQVTDLHRWLAAERNRLLSLAGKAT